MNSKKDDTTRQIVNVVVFILTIAVNVLSNALPLNGRTAGEISDALPTYFTPAGYAFAVWSLIYLSLLGFIVYQALPSQRENQWLRQIGYLPAVANLLNAGWLFAWHYGIYWLSVLIMLGLLASLLLIYIKLQAGVPGVERSWQDVVFIVFPMTLYFAWINVATVANVATTFVAYGLTNLGLGGPTWSVVMIAVVTLVATAVLLNRASLPYAGVLIWALLAIRVKQSGVPTVPTAALAASVVIFAAALFGWWRAFAKGRSASTAVARSA